MFGSAGHLPELIIILILGLIILGPGKLPQVGGAVGKTIREFRRGAQEADEEESDKAAAAAPKSAPVATATPTEPATPAASTTVVSTAPAPSTTVIAPKAEAVASKAEEAS